MLPNKTACLPLAQFPLLETRRFQLREITMDDAEANFRLRTDVDAMRFIDRAKPTSEAEKIEAISKIKAMEAAGEGLAWAICFKGEKELIGHIGLFRVNHAHFYTEVGYMLFPKYWRQGIMSEVMESVIDYVFHELPFHRLEADINPLNEASRALLLKFGFRKEAYFKENYYFNGQFLDSEIYGLLRSEWMKNQS